MIGKLRLKGIITMLIMLALVCVPMAGKAMAASLELSDQTGQIGSSVTYTLSVSSAPNAVSSLGLDIAYDQTALTYVSAV
jgi:hypothetical protein